jgi:hypothetical protein
MQWLKPLFYRRQNGARNAHVHPSARSQPDVSSRLLWRPTVKVAKFELSAPGRGNSESGSAGLGVQKGNLRASFPVVSFLRSRLPTRAYRNELHQANLLGQEDS